MFLIVAQRNSFKIAASELRVTPGAISHQVRVLEDSLGVKLFARRNNSIELTEAGSKLMQQALPGIHILNASLDNVTQDAHELRVQVSMSLATRWLIPKLGLFKKQNPLSHVRIESIFGIGVGPNPDVDVASSYYKRDEMPKGATILFEDKCRPYLSPALLSDIADPTDLTSVPALQCSEGNWDWELWLRDSGLTETNLNITGRFDLDDAALRAAIAGMGMVLASGFMIQDDIATNRLCPLPHSAEVTLGFYVIHQSNRETGLSKRFVQWLGAVDPLSTFGCITKKLQDGS